MLCLLSSIVLLFVVFFVILFESFSLFFLYFECCYLRYFSVLARVLFAFNFLFRRNYVSN